MPVRTPEDLAAPGAVAAGLPDEKRGDIHFAAKDAGLRQDVHQLGAVVGEVLKDQGGSTLYSRVEQSRRAAIDAREGDPTGVLRLEALVSEVSGTEALDFIRAFSTYFQVVNIAEMVHRIRRRRDYLREERHRQPGGLEDTLHDLRDAGLPLDQIRAAIAELYFEPVLTAHPTEPTRRTILRRQKGIVRRLIEMQNPALSRREREADLANIRDDITAIWQTEEHPPGARTVAEEQEHMLFFLTDCIYRMLPQVYESFETALDAVWGEAAHGIPMPVMVRVASWIGGDLVGRGEITARTLRELLGRQRSLILDLYHGECRVLAEQLSQSTTRVGTSQALEERIELYSSHFPNAVGITPLRHREMRYRVFMRLVMNRLESTYGDGLFPYESADELADDLRVVEDSLRGHRGAHAGLFAVRRLIRRVEAFGFQFMTMDLRQDARATRRIVGRALGEPDWEQRPEEYRVRRLREALATNTSPLGEADNDFKRAVGILQVVAHCRRRFGARSIGPYVISRTEGIDDVLSVLLIAEWGELLRKSGAVPLDIAPAFETATGLAAAAEIMDRLYADPVYRAHLDGRGGRQIVMTGVTEGDVEFDLATARWTVLRGQRALLDSAAQAGIGLEIFHGRSGPIAMAGGKVHAEILSGPPDAVRHGVRALEPGELVANKYGVRPIAVRTIEQVLAAMLRTRVRPTEPAAGDRPEWEAALDMIVAGSRACYQALVVESPGFHDYYRLATPADVIERMRRGDGPDEALSSGILAAAGTVPWVFAWTQTRNVLPGWYGFGAGLAQALERFGEDLLREMAAGWFFFRTLLTDVETALAKSDLQMASRYSRLGGDLHERFFPRICAEFSQATEAVLQVTRQQVLLEHDNTLRRSIRLRNPYVDPMNVLQVDLLRRWRQTGDEALFHALIASVNGIARGLQDSG